MRTWISASAPGCWGQALVEQTGPYAAKIYRLVSDPEPLVLTGEVQQISQQLARATIYLLADELVRYPDAEQPARLAAIKQDKGFGFDMKLLTPDQADMDEDQRRRISEGDTVMALQEQAKSMLGNPEVIFIDVRAPKDWNAPGSKIKGAVREDPSNISSWAEKYPKEKTLLFYCA